MKIRFKTAVLFIAALGLISFQAKADVVYDNGPISGTIPAWTIGYGYVVSDSFTVSSPASLTLAEVGLSDFTGYSPLSLDWAIGTSVFGSEISSGTALLNNNSAGISSLGYPVFNSTFAINGMLTGGTYYFTLQNAVSTSGGPVYWDPNNGPSLAFHNTLGQLPGSQAFTLYGESVGPGTTGSSVPDASATIALLGGALAGLALMRRRLMS